MTTFSDALTLSADLHTLAGSTPPGAARPMQPFGIAATPAVVAELPDTFRTLPDLAGGIVAGLRPASPDAEVIDLAERVAALVVREHALWDRRSAVEGAVDDATPLHPARSMHTSSPSFNDTLAEYDRHVAEVGARMGLPRWEKLSGRASCRLARWGARLAKLAPQTQVGLKAKAAASTACIEREVYTLNDWRKDLATSISADALRIATALCEEGAGERMVEMHRETLAMQAIADDPAIDQVTSDRACHRVNELERLAISTSQPRTMAEVTACIEWALADHERFRMKDSPDQGDHLLFALLTGALGVLKASPVGSGLERAA